MDKEEENAGCARRISSVLPYHKQQPRHGMRNFSNERESMSCQPLIAGKNSQWDRRRSMCDLSREPNDQSTARRAFLLPSSARRKYIHSICQFADSSHGRSDDCARVRFECSARPGQMGNALLLPRFFRFLIDVPRSRVLLPHDEARRLPAESVFSVAKPEDRFSIKT